MIYAIARAKSEVDQQEMAKVPILAPAGNAADYDDGANRSCFGVKAENSWLPFGRRPAIYCLRDLIIVDCSLSGGRYA